MSLGPSRELRFLVLSAITALAGACLSTVPASAATYDVFSCAAPGGLETSSAGWSTAADTDDAASFPSLACPRSDLTNEASPNASHPRGANVGMRWTAAPNTAVVAFGLDHRVHAPADPQFRWGWEYRVAFAAPGTASPLALNVCLSPSNSCENQKDFNAYDTSQFNGHRASAIMLLLTCTTRFPEDCPAGYGARLSVKSARFTVEDTTTPRITSTPTGELVDPSAVASGPADVRFLASDTGGGVYEAIVEIDGVAVLRKTVDDAGGRCVQPFRDPAPCVETVAAALSYDTSALPDGPHSVRLLVTDATGANTVAYGPVEILTVNGNPPSGSRLRTITCAPVARSTVAVSARSRVVGFGRRLRLKGRVKNAMPGGLVAIVGNDDAGVSTTARLNSRGRFRTRLRPTQSQSIRAIYLAPGTQPACSRTLPIRVRARSTLSASRQRLKNRDVLRLSGRVLGTVPTSGKKLVLRVRGAGSKHWYRAGTVQSDSTGHWTWRYRFTRTSRRTTYVFRARLPRQRGFRYAVGGSRVVRVTVVP
jgi:hypothetical protein